MSTLSLTRIDTIVAARRRRLKIIVAGMLLPLLAVNALAFVFPVIRLLTLSFVESQAGVLGHDFTLGNYAEFFSDNYYLTLIANSLRMSLATTLATLLLAYPLALFIYRSTSRWRNLLFILTISPLLVSSVVRTFGWMVILGDRGIVNETLRALGLIQEPIALINNNLGVGIGLVETLIPYMVLSLIAGFGNLNPLFEEAAASLGANAFFRFFRVVLPLTAPGIALGCMFCFVLSISSFITPKLLGGGRVFLLATEIYDQAIIQLQWSMAAAISIIVLLIFGLTLFFYGRYARRFD